jgi:general nucleoside transport system permease protein
MSRARIPNWADVTLVPLLSVVLAFVISGILIWAIGESPWAAVKLMVTGAFGSSYGWGYTLYYATNFIFTGLAVSIAFQARLFNIGGEGQALIAGLGVALILLYIPWPHWTIALVAATVAAAAFGAAWALVPAWLQAKRGSHIVITTIMFNFIAASVLNYVLVNFLRPTGSMDPSIAQIRARNGTCRSCMKCWPWSGFRFPRCRL